MKKIVSLLLVLVLTLSCSSIVSASDNYYVTTLKLSENKVNTDNRYIKVSWEDTGFYQIQIDTTDTFENPMVKMNSDNRIVSYCFNLSENIDATYYIRISPDRGEHWSNVVVADPKNEIFVKPNGYMTFPSLPPILDYSKPIIINPPVEKDEDIEVETEVEETETESEIGVTESEILEVKIVDNVDNNVEKPVKQTFSNVGKVDNDIKEDIDYLQLYYDYLRWFYRLSL